MTTAEYGSKQLLNQETTGGNDERLVVQEQLADWLGFTPDELAANRSGRLSTRQHRDMLYRHVGDLVRGAVAFCLGCILLATVAQSADRVWEQVLSGMAFVALIVLGGTWVLAIARLAHPQVHTVSGSLCRGANPAKPHVVIGSTSLRITFRRWKHLPDHFGGRYRAYYDSLNTLLSVELIDEDIPT